MNFEPIHIQGKRFQCSKTKNKVHSSSNKIRSSDCIPIKELDSEGVSVVQSSVLADSLGDLGHRLEVGELDGVLEGVQVVHHAVVGLVAEGLKQ